MPTSLISQSLELTPEGRAPDPGLLVFRAFSCQTFFWTHAAAFEAHVSILSAAHALLQRPGGSPDEDPTNMVREIQLNSQYLGVSPGVQSEAYSQVLTHVFPSVAVSKIGHAPHTLQRAGSQIRLGIVSEHEHNSSPGIALMNVLESLAARTHAHPAGRPGERESDYDIVFFKRDESFTTSFTAVTSRIARKTVQLLEAPGLLEENRRLIADERLDILLYVHCAAVPCRVCVCRVSWLRTCTNPNPNPPPSRYIALPTEKFSSYLAHSRLAPLQVVFGVGHPLTSGNRAIDYSIVSADMFSSLQTLLPPQPSVALCMRMAGSCKAEIQAARSAKGKAAANFASGPACEAMRENGCAKEAREGSGGAVGAHYTEQLVVFDSMAYFLESMLHLYKVKIEPLALSFDSPCEALDAKLAQWGLHPQVRAEELGCRPAVGAPRTTRTKRLYACIQIPRKMHTSFDAVLLGVLRQDPSAVLLLEGRVKQFLPRWTKAGMTSHDLQHRLVLLPRLAHPEYLQLLSLASVFLNTFPFGAGITSSEALSVCVPVVVYAEMSSVLHLALAQVRKLGPRWAQEWIAHSTEEYVRRAVAVATIPQEAERQYRGAICEAREQLLGRANLEEVTQEWDGFLKRIWQAWM